MFLWLLINPGNLMMALAIVIGSFLKEFWQRLFLVVVATSILRFEPRIRLEEIIFAAVVFLAIILIDKMPFCRSANILISLLAALLVFNFAIFLL